MVKNTLKDFPKLKAASSHTLFYLTVGPKPKDNPFTII